MPDIVKKTCLDKDTEWEHALQNEGDAGMHFTGLLECVFYFSLGLIHQSARSLNSLW